MEQISPKQALLILVGIGVVALVAFDIFQSIIVPAVTPKNLRIAPFLLGKLMWPNYRRIVLALPQRWQHSLFDVFAPSSYVVLLLTWFLCFIGGFGLILLGCGGQVKPPITSYSEALYFASTSFLTLGFGDLVAHHAVARVFVIAAAVMGLIFMALEISFLFTLQTYLQMREQVVNTVISRAGSPASGVVLLLRYRELNIVPSLSTSFVHWEQWVATILESHRAFPMLIFFRSSHSRNSWVSTMGALLDASTFLTATIESEKVGEAELFYWLGTTTLKALCSYLGLPTYDGEHLADGEFTDSLYLLNEAGYKVKKAEDCVHKFLQYRSAYMRYLIPLAMFLAQSPPVLVRALPIMAASGAASSKKTGERPGV